MDIQTIFSWIDKQKKFVLFVCVPAIALLLIITWITIHKPKPKYDSLNNPFVEQIIRDQEIAINDLKVQLEKVGKELKDKKYADSVNDVSIDSEILFLKNRKNTTTIIYEKNKQNIILDDVDADIADLRRRLPQKGNSK